MPASAAVAHVLAKAGAVSDSASAAVVVAGDGADAVKKDGRKHSRDASDTDGDQSTDVDGDDTGAGTVDEDSDTTPAPEVATALVEQATPAAAVVQHNDAPVLKRSASSSSTDSASCYLPLDVKAEEQSYSDLVPNARLLPMIRDEQELVAAKN